MLKPLGQRILVQPIAETAERHGLILTSETKTYLRCKVLVGKDDVPVGSVVLINANTGIESDYGIIVGLVDVLAVEA